MSGRKGKKQPRLDRVDVPNMQRLQNMYAPALTSHERLDNNCTVMELIRMPGAGHSTTNATRREFSQILFFMSE